MKLYMKTIIILVIITVIGISGYFVWQYLTAPEKTEVKSKQEPVKIEELVEMSVDTDQITANFADGKYINVQFKLITKSKTDAEEIKKMSFKTTDAIIKTINQIKMTDAVGPKGFTLIEKSVKENLNKALGKDSITHVYLIDKLIQ